MKKNRLAWRVAAFAAVSLILVLAAQQALTPSGQFSANPPMSAARQGAASAVLSDGRILVTGGQDSTGPLASAEFLSGSTAGTMATPRYAHIAVALKDGTVLVAGGRTTGDAVTNAAELYAGGAWTPISAMLVARAGATATLLQDGRVLIAGGQGSGGALQTTEIFDPASGQFNNGPPMSTVRQNHAAALLPDGRVILAGGSDGSNALASIDLFDPATGAIAPFATMSAARDGLSATTLMSGKVLLAGGTVSGNPSASTEILDVTAAATAAGPAMSTARSAHMALLLPNNNTVLMAGGTTASAAAEIFVEWQNAFAPFGSLSSARTAVTGGASSQSASAAVAGGVDSGGAVSAAVDAVRFPMVTTDKPDYQPGDTATITGSGFAPNEIVNVIINEVVDIDHDSPITLTPAPVADSSGSFTVQFPIDVADLNVHFYLNATGQTSGLTAGTAFTDGSVTVKASSGSTFTLTSQKYNDSSTCAASPIGSPSNTPLVDSTTGFTTGVGTNQHMLLTAAATSDQGGAFINWTSATSFTGTNPICVSSTTATYIANYAATVAVTLATSPTGLQISADGGTTYFTAPHTFNLAPGSKPTIVTTSPQSGGAGKQYVWTSWSDSGAISHQITVPASNTTYTANFKTQWLLTFTVAGTDGDYTGTVVTVGGNPIAAGSFSSNSYTQWADDNSAAPTVVWNDPLTSSVTGKRYHLTGSTSLTSPVTGAQTSTGTYKKQWLVTFHQTGVGVDAGTNTVLTLTAGPTNYNQSQFDVTQWVDDGTGISFTWAPTVATSVTGKQYALVSSSATSPLTVTAAVTVTGTYKTQYQVTFHQTGVGVDAGTNTVLTLTAGPTNYNQSQFDVTQWVDNNGSISFTWAPTVATSVTGKQYALVSSSATSPLTVTAAVIVTGTYKIQYQVTFNQSGIGGDTTANVLTGDYAKTAAQLPYSAWYDSGATLTYAFTSPLASTTTGKQYVLTTPAPAPVSGSAVSGPAAVTGTYKIQYQVTFNQSGIGGDTTANVLTGDYTKTAAQLPYSAWYDSGTTLTYAFTSPLASTTAGKQYLLTTPAPAPVSGSAVSGPAAVTGTYKIQYQITFNQSGIGGDTTANVLTGDYAKTAAQLPYSAWYDSGTTLTYAFTSPLASTTAGKQYVLTTPAPAPVSGSAVSGPATVTGTYKIQYQVTFTQSGIGGDTTAAVLTGDYTKTAAQLPYSAWYDSGTTLTYAFTSPLASTTAGKQYLLTTPAPAPVSGSAVGGPATVTGTYKIQYQITFTQSGIGGDTTANVLTGDYTKTAAQLPYSAWYDSGTTLTYAFTSPLASTTTGKQYLLTTPAPAPVSGSAVSGPATVTGTYKIQYQVTFTQTGIGGDTGANQVLSLSVNAAPASMYSAGTLPGATWYDAGTSFAYTYSSPVATSDPNKQYVLTSAIPNPSPASPIGSLSAPTTVTGAYKTQYKVTFTQTGIGVDTGANQVLSLSINGGGATGYDASHLTTPSTWYDDGTSLGYAYTGTVSTSPVSGKQYALTGTTPSSPYVVHAGQTINGAYKTQWLVTFHQTGVGVDATTNTVLTLTAGPTNYNQSQFDVTQWVDDSTSISFTWAATVATSTTGKQYAFVSSSAGSPLGPVTAAVTVTATYKTQYQVTFNQTGISSDANAAIVTVEGSGKNYAANPLYQAWYDSGTNVTFSYSATVSSSTAGKQYVLTGVTPNSTSPQAVTAAITFNGTYKIQYQVTFTQTGIGGDTGANQVLSLIVNGGPASMYSAGTLPGATWYDAGTSFAYTYSSPVATSDPNKQYVLTSAVPNPSPASPIGSLSAPTTVTGAYKTQYKVTFTQTGIGVDTGANQVLSLSINGGGATGYDASHLTTPSTWYDDGTSLGYTYAATVSTSPVSGKQYALTGTTPSSPYVVHAGQTINGAYKTQWLVTFHQTGVGVDAGTNTVLTLTAGPTNYNRSQFDVMQWVDDSTSISFTWAATVATSTTGKQYAFVSSSAGSPLGPVTAPVTVTGTYKTQWQITFKQTGIGVDAASNTVVTVNGTPHPIGDFDVTAWVDDTSGSVTYGYAGTVAASPGKQYVLTNVGSLPASPITGVMAPMTLTGIYKTQYMVTFTQTGIGVDTGTNQVLSLTINGGGAAAYDASHLTTPSTWYDDGTSLGYTYTGTVSTTPVSGKQYVLTGTTPSSPYVVHAAQTVNGTYKTQYMVTFTQTGIGVDTGTNQVLSLMVNGGGATNYDASHLTTPSTWYDDGTSLGYTYTGTVSTSPVSGKQYALTSTTPSSPYVVHAAQTINGAYKTQWLVTYKEAGTISSDAGANTVLTLHGITNYNQSQFDVTEWVDDGGAITYAYASPVATSTTGKRYALTTPVPSPVTGSVIHAATMITGTYKTQYFLTITVSPGAVGRANVSPNPDAWYDSGTVVNLTATTPVIVLPSTSFTFSNWSGDISTTSNPTSVTMNGPRNVTANYDTWILTWDTGSVFTAQYSDPTGLEADLTKNGLAVSGIAIHFSVGADASSPDPTTTIPLSNLYGYVTDTTKLSQAPGPYTAKAACAACGGLTITMPYTITQEDAKSTYTGPTSYNTACPTCTSTTVPLSATIQDITALSTCPGGPNDDCNPGDIRNAHVIFRDTISNTTLCTATLSLVNPLDPKTANATCSFTASISSGNSTMYTISVLVGVDSNKNPAGYYVCGMNAYTLCDIGEDLIVMEPSATNFVTGGGYIVLANSAGAVPGNSGTHNNFGFGIHYNKSGSALQGHFNAVYRSSVKAPGDNCQAGADGLYIYQIDSTSLNAPGESLSVQLNAKGAGGTATLYSKATLTDVTNPLAQCSITDNAQLQVGMFDSGLPTGQQPADTISISLTPNGGGTAWYISDWTGKVVQDPLKGNIAVH